ncbi:MAG: hypothetical protein WAU08_07975 [Flavobacteriales bacterium]
MTRVKTILLSTAILFSVVACAQSTYSRTDPANGDAALATTEEEYNYLTKGYAIQVASGLDMKRGYTFADMGGSVSAIADGTRGTEFKGLMRDGGTTPCAILLIYKKPTGELVYFCIPTYNADSALWDRTFKQVHDAAAAYNSSSMDTEIIMSLMHLSTLLATQ